MTLSIIGFGKFGRLLGELLSKFFDEILVYDSNSINVSRDCFKFVSIDVAAKADIVILAVPISEFVNILKEISEHLKKGALVIDVCSVKVFTAFSMQKFLPNDVSLLGTHPMWGPDSVKANKGIDGLKLVICPIRIAEEIFGNIKKKLEENGLNVIVKTPKNHDEEAATSQALAQFIGKILETMPLKKSDIGTMGYDQLRGLLPFVENNSQQLFNDLQTYNQFTSEVRKRFLEIALMLSGDLGKMGKKKSVNR